ncbi:MAG: GGDEF domain-containing phosphodiesterase, partial [Pseudomonadota bacterium]
HQPIEVPGQSLHLSACAGVALFPRDADSVDTLMQRADNAMRAAQSRGGGLRFYCPDSDAAAERKLKIEQMLSEALDQDELRVAYQPIVNVADDRVHAVEALLRWSRPDGTVIRPMEFVPVAEESGLMLRLGDFVLRQACKQAAAWHRAGIKTPTMCVNVAKVQLMEGDFVERVERILAETGLAPQYLELELSERGVLGGDGDVVSQLHALRALGVRLSLDDFGTGESAIGYLKELPIDVLKIDRSYVTDIVGNSRDAAIASAMVALGQGLGLEVIAEGVEEEGQLEALKRLSCNYYQGFLFGKAAPPEAVEKLLATTTSLTVQAGA